MNVTVLAPDSKIPNLAAEKARLYHQQRGDTVYDLDIFIPISEVVYVSLVFTKSHSLGEHYSKWPQVQVGGTGWDLSTKLPPEIEKVNPRINYGFTSRGCNNRCPFCVVRDKEGKAHSVGDIYDVWDGKSKIITLLDNNILQLPEHFDMIYRQAVKEKIRIDFNQGLDHKLLTPEICGKLKQIKSKTLHFAFDNPRDEPSMRRAVEMLKGAGITRSTWYVLVGYNTTVEEDLRRIDICKRLGQDPYIMRFESVRGDLFYNDLASWCNQPAMLKKMSFDNFRRIRHPHLQIGEAQ